MNSREVGLIFAIYLGVSFANDVKFLKIENCTTSGKTTVISTCEIANNKLTVEGSVTAQISDVMVSA
jgi:hypothetical protein